MKVGGLEQRTLTVECHWSVSLALMMSLMEQHSVKYAAMREGRIAYRRQVAGSFYERWCRRLAASKWRHALRRGSWG